LSDEVEEAGEVDYATKGKEAQLIVLAKLLERGFKVPASLNS